MPDKTKTFKVNIYIPSGGEEIVLTMENVMGNSPADAINNAMAELPNRVTKTIAEEEDPGSKK